MALKTVTLNMKYSRLTWTTFEILCSHTSRSLIDCENNLKVSLRHEPSDERTAQAIFPRKTVSQTSRLLQCIERTSVRLLPNAYY